MNKTHDEMLNFVRDLVESFWKLNFSQLILYLIPSFFPDKRDKFEML